MKQIQAYDLLLELLEVKSSKEIEDYLLIHHGTLKRWLSLKRVPDDYLIDFNRLLENKYQIDNPDVDEYFTKPQIARYCFDVLTELIDTSDYTFIEPSAGDCSFFDLFPLERRIGIDIKPKNNNLIGMNYLEYEPPKGKYIVVGNPPFGLRGNLALRFIKHSAKFADIVAFILPPLFNSTGKGVPATRINEYNVLHTENLPLASFVYPNGKDVQVSTIFQIYTKSTRYKAKTKTCSSYIKIYSMSDGGTPGTTRNKHMFDKCDVYMPSTCFSGNMKVCFDFNSLPGRRGYGIVILRDKDELMKMFQNLDLEKEAFVGTNSSLNLNFATINNILISRGYCDADADDEKRLHAILSATM